MMQLLHDRRVSRAVLISNFPCGSPHAGRVGEQLDRIRDLLVDDVRWGLDRDHCIRVPEPSTANHMDFALEAGSKAADGGLLLVYYAGHLLVTPEHGLYMTTPDTDPDDLDNTAFPMNVLRWHVRYSRASRRLFVLDCCYDGLPNPGTGQGDPVSVLAKLATIDKTALLVTGPAGHGGCSGGRNGSPLAAELGRVLSEGLPDGPAFLDVGTVLDHLRSGTLSGHRIEHSGEPVVLARNVAVYGPDRTGQVLCATPSVDDPELADSVIMILRYDREAGALGVVLNRPGRRRGGDVAPGWAQLLDDPAVVFDGGPVHHEGFIPVVALRTNTPPPVRFRPVAERLGTMPLSVEPGAIGSAVEHVRLFSGYVGWGPGELEDDLARERLVPVGAGVDDVFSADPARLWQTFQESTS